MTTDQQPSGARRAPDPPAGASRIGVDLGPRLMSGLALAAAAVGLTWLGAGTFAGLVLAVALMVAWEWGRVVRHSDGDLALVAHGLTAAVALWCAWTGVRWGLSLAIVAAGAILTALASRGVAPLLSAVGVLYVGLPVLSLVWLRSDPTLGLAAILLLYLCVWGTDTAAYFSGRLLGGPKLWPRISPNKTWSGLIGGVSASMISAAIFALFIAGASSWRLAALGLALGLVAQAGDLAESALKRGQGVKDASALIPGHGGFLDRIDGFVVAVTVAALIAWMVDPAAPARSLLIGRS